MQTSRWILFVSILAVLLHEFQVLGSSLSHYLNDWILPTLKKLKCRENIETANETINRIVKDHIYAFDGNWSQDKWGKLNPNIQDDLIVSIRSIARIPDRPSGTSLQIQRTGRDPRDQITIRVAVGGDLGDGEMAQPVFIREVVVRRDGTINVRRIREEMQGG
jgi:hypothetical protein